MRKIMRYPVYPITFCYVNGIFFAKYFPFANNLLYPCIAFLLIWIFFLIKPPKQLYSVTTLVLFTSILSVFFCAGALNYKKQIELPTISFTEDFFQVVILERLKPNPYSHRYYAEFYKENHKYGTFLIYQSIEESPYHVGEVLYDKLTLQPVTKSSIPYDFDYQDFLHSKGVSGQAYLTSQVQKIGVRKDFWYYLTHFRNVLLQSFEPYYESKNDRALIAGLLFGQKQDLDGTLEQAYRNAGVMHVLAVSGMHVMILFFTFHYILQRIIANKYALYGIIAILLVCFAFLSGLSASVVRAVLMCILYLIAKIVRRDTHTIHTMVVSMLLILWFAPNFLFDIGFQLSYLAVFSIVFIYPLLRPYFTSKYFIINYFTETLGISLAAQTGVAILSMYYFKQFPIWFLLGNLVAVPITSVSIILLLLQLVFNFIFSPIAQAISWIVNLFLSWGNCALLQINALDTKVLDEIHLSTIEMIFYTMLIFLYVGWFRYKSIRYLYTIFTLLIFWKTVMIGKLLFFNEREMILIANKENWAIIEKQKGMMQMYGNEYFLSQIKSFKKNEMIVESHFMPVEKYVEWEKSLLVVDSTWVNTFPIRANYVLLKDNPRINIERLVNDTQCEFVIIHPHNNYGKRKQWKEWLQKKNIPYHDMREKGYVSMD